MKKHREVLYTDNAWRISRYESPYWRLWLEHNCPKCQYLFDTWQAYFYSLIGQAYNFECSNCHSAPSGGLQAIFWFFMDAYDSSH